MTTLTTSAMKKSNSTGALSALGGAGLPMKRHVSCNSLSTLVANAASLAFTQSVNDDIASVFAPRVESPPLLMVDIVRGMQLQAFTRAPAYVWGVCSAEASAYAQDPHRDAALLTCMATPVEYDKETMHGMPPIVVRVARDAANRADQEECEDDTCVVEEIERRTRRRASRPP